MQGGKTCILCVCMYMSYSSLSIDHTFQSEGSIAEELSSLETCVSVSIVRETNPWVFFPSLNRSTDAVSSHSAPLPATSPQGSAEQLDTQTTTGYMSDSTSKTLPSEKPKLVPLSHSTTKQAMTSYHGHVVGLLDVLQSAVGCRVARAPSVIPIEAIKLPCKISPPEAGKGGDSVRRKTLGVSDSDCDTVWGCASVAVLFSGGVDSAVLAALVDR